MMAITRALAPAVASPEGRPKKGMMGNSHHRRLKAGGIWRDAGEGGRRGGKVWPGPRHFDAHGGGPFALSHPGAKTAVSFSLGIRLFRAPRRAPFAHRPFSWGTSFRGRGGLVVNLRAVDGTHAAFFLTAASGVSIARSCSYGLGLRRKPDASGGTTYSRVNLRA
jgi:hypothetical protein